MAGHERCKVNTVREGFPLISEVGPVKPDSRVVLPMRTRAFFRPKEFIVTPLVAQSFWLAEVKVGSHSIPFRRDKDRDFWLCGGRLPLDQIGEVAPCLDLVLVLHNRLDAPRFFYGEVWGDLEKASLGQPWPV